MPFETSVVLSEAGSPEVSLASATAFVSNLTRGVYTTLRTVHDDRETAATSRLLFMPEAHIERLATSARVLCDREGIPVPANLASPEAVSAPFMAGVAAILGHIPIAYPLLGPEIDYRVTVHAALTAPNAMSFHLRPIRSTDSHPRLAVCAKGHRHSAAAKSTDWLEARRELARRWVVSGPLAEEVLLIETGEPGAGKPEPEDPADFHILEGLSSNFAAIVRGIDSAGKHTPVLLTAGAGVLDGTMMRLCVEAAESLGWPVVRSPPRLTEATTWLGAVVTSTSRYVTPLAQLWVPEGAAGPGLEPSASTGYDSILLPMEASHRLAATAKGLVLAHATPLE
jgi:hypothetical protein